MNSRENCLGHPSFRDFNQPVCVEEFSSQNVIDVACGHHFTVVISTKSSNELGYKNLKEFKTSLLKNAELNIIKIKEYCSSKLKKNDSEARMIKSRGSSLSQHEEFSTKIRFQEMSVKSQRMLTFTPNKNKRSNSQQQPAFISHQGSYSQFQTQPTTPIRKSASSILKNEEKVDMKPVGNSQFQQLIVQEKIFSQNIKTRLHLLNQDQKNILQQFPLTTRPQSHHSREVSVGTSKQKMIPSISEILMPSSVKAGKPTFFEYSNNKIVFDSVHEDLDQRYHDFEEIQNFDIAPKAIPTAAPTKQVSHTQAVKSQNKDELTRREKLSELKKQAEIRRNNACKIIKGIVLDDNIFNNEIDQIYKEYQDADLIDKPKKVTQKYVRPKEDNFLIKREQLSSDIREKFQEVKHDLKNSKSYITCVTDRTLLQTQNFIKSSVQTHCNTTQKSMSLHVQTFTAIGGQEPESDFYKKQRFKSNNKYQKEQQEIAKKRFQERDQRITSALQKKKDIETQKKEERDDKRKDIIQNSAAFKKYNEEMQIFNRNQDSVRMNWMIYLNAELIAKALKTVAILGQEKIRENFFFLNRVKRIQRMYKKKMMAYEEALQKSQYLCCHLCLQATALTQQESVNQKSSPLNPQFHQKQDSQQSYVQDVCFQKQCYFTPKLLEMVLSLSKFLAEIANSFMGYSCSSCNSIMQQNITKYNIFYQLCSGEQGRHSDPKNLETIKEMQEKLSSLTGIKKSQISESSQNFDGFFSFLKKEQDRQKKAILQNESAQAENVEDMIMQKGENDSSKLGTFMQQLKIGIHSQNAQLGEAMIKHEAENQPVLRATRSVRIGECNPETKPSSLQTSVIEEQSSKKEQEDDTTQEKSASGFRGSQFEHKKKNMSFDFTKTLLPYSLHSNDVFVPPQFGIRLDIIKQNDAAKKIATISESTIKKKFILQILRNLRQKHKQQLEQFGKICQQFMEDNAHKINMERARLMLKTPPAVLNQIWKREQEELKLRKMRKQEIKRDHLPFYDLKDKIASEIPNAPIKPSFKIVLSFESFNIHFSNYVDSVRKQYTILEKKKIIKLQTKKKEE